MTRQLNTEMPRMGRIVLVPSRPDQRDGYIWHWQTNPSRIAGQAVRLLAGKPRQPQQPLWDEHFLNTADVVEAFKRGNKEEAEACIREQLDDEVLADSAIKNPMAYVCAQFASGLKGAEFVVWWRDREQRLDVGIYCPNQRSASYVQLLAMGTEPFPTTKCLECGRRIFCSRWHPKVYCSKRCRNTHNVRESRKRRRRNRKRARKAKHRS